MKITIEFLRSKRACAEGTAYFVQHFGESAEYQDVLDALAADDHADWAAWLLKHAGADSTAVKTITDAPTTRHIFACGRLVFSVPVSVVGMISAGEGISAGFSIRCRLYLSVRLRVFAGTCGWRLPDPEEQQIVCRKLLAGTVAFGTLIETKTKTEVAAQ